MARVLYLEDDPLAGEVVRQLLVAAGHDCSVIESPELGLEAIRSGKPEMLIVDMGLPGMTGDRVVEAVRMETGVHLTPILVLTGSGDSKVHTCAMLAGANGVITKHATEDEFVARVETIFSANSFRRTRRRDSHAHHAFAAAQSPL